MTNFSPDIPVSGRQYAIAAGDYEAHIASVGGTLRAVTFRGEDLVSPFNADEMVPGMRGGLLAPWPNRIRDGVYTFDGTTYQLPINEVAANNASHGLVFTQGFGRHEQTENSVTLRAVLEPQRGYPWRVQVDTQFTVTPDGFTQRVTATNLSATAAPYGVATHPYFLAGDEHESAIDEWTLQLPARTFLTADDRALPIADADVASDEGGAYDFRSPRVIGETQLDTAFTDLEKDDDGVTRVRLTGPDGRGIEMSMGESAKWVQVFTAHKSRGEKYRSSIAIEPMTCPAEAFNSGRDLIVLQPGESAEMVWGVRRI